MENLFPYKEEFCEFDMLGVRRFMEKSCRNSRQIARHHDRCLQSQPSESRDRGSKVLGWL
jgi:hypothetical protein